MLKVTLQRHALSSVKVKQLNYPYNCFTLDLSQNDQTKKKGLKQIFFHFPIINSSRVELLLEDRDLACTRETKEN